MKEAGQRYKVTFSARNYLDMPIIVGLPDLGLRLTFKCRGAQELILIEVLDFSHIQFSYKNCVLNEISFEAAEDPTSLSFTKSMTPPTLKEIYNKIVGPTFPGVLMHKQGGYLLSYPGVAFMFTIQSLELLAKASSLDDQNVQLSKLLNWSNAADLPCSLVAVFNGEDYGSFHKTLKAQLTSSGHAETTAEPALERINVFLKEGLVDVVFVKDNSRTTHTIEIGKTTQQEILGIFGPSEASFNKFDSRLVIHKQLKAMTSSLNPSSACKFHNYYRYGLDFLYNLNSSQGGGVLDKIIVHNGGIAESLEFMQWNKCCWEIFTDRTSSAALVTSDMYFLDFGSEFFEKVKSQKPGPVLLNRNEAEFVKDEDLEIIDLTEVHHTVSTNSSIELSLSNKFKTWGQLKLHGYKNCVWEVVESNDCVACVTIY